MRARVCRFPEKEFTATLTTLAGANPVSLKDSWDILEVVLRMQYPQWRTTLIVIGFVAVLSCCIWVYCLLLCREWLCQYQWARRYQYF